MSQAERSVAGRHIRQFDIDELVAFARAFDLPIGWFLLPPPPWAQPGVPVKLDTPDAGEFGHTLGILIDLVFGTPEHQGLLAARLEAFLEQNGDLPLAEHQERIQALVRAKTAALATSALDDLEHWQTMLRGLANQLEDLEARARRAAAAELDIDPT